MDKKKTVAIVILFTMIVIGSIVYTIFSVVRTDGLQVDTRANVIKEEMVSMEQSIDNGNVTGEDTDKDNTTTNSTVNTNQYPNNVNSNNDNNLNQNTTADNSGNNGSTEGNNNPSVEKPNNGDNTEDNGKKPWVIKNSIFQINQGSSSYQDGIGLRQDGTNIYITVDRTKIESEDVAIPIWVQAPESYPVEDTVYYGIIGEQNLPLDGYYLYNDTPFIVFALGYIQGESETVSIGWLDGGVITYTIHFM